MLVGTNVTFFPMFFLGQDGMPRRISRYPSHPGWGTLNLIESVGAAIIALGDPGVPRSMSRSRCAPACRPARIRGRGTRSSGQPAHHRREYNFDRPLPAITSYAPLLDLRHRAQDREGLSQETPA